MVRMGGSVFLALCAVSALTPSPPPPSFAQTSSLAAPEVTVPQEPVLSQPPPPPSWNVAHVNASTSSPNGVHSGNQESPCSSGITTAQGVPPTWWMTGSILLWRLLPFIGIGAGCLMCCCLCCLLLKPRLCSKSRHHMNEYPRSRQQRHATQGDPHRGHYDNRPPSWYRPRSLWRSGGGWDRRSEADLPPPRAPFRWHGGSFPSFGASGRWSGGSTRSCRSGGATRDRRGPQAPERAHRSPHRSSFEGREHFDV